MAHELEFRGDGTAVFVGSQPAWHNLGVVTGELLTIEDVIRNVPEFGMDVYQSPTYTPIVSATEEVSVVLHGEYTLQQLLLTLCDEGLLAPTKKWAQVREDGMVIGENSDKYVGFPGRDLLNFGGALLETGGGDVMIETAGMLRGGRVQFITFKLDREMMVNGAKFEPYLPIWNSSDGSLAFTASINPVAVVCANTLRMAQLSSVNEYRISHRANMMQYVANARDLLGLANKHLDDFEIVVEVMQESKFTTREFDLLLDAIWPEPDSNRGQTLNIKMKDALRELWDSSVYVGEFKGTRWGAFQAVNTYELWGKRTNRGKGDERGLSVIQAERQMLGLMRHMGESESDVAFRLLVGTRSSNGA